MQMEFLDLSHQNLLENKLSQLNLPFSEYSFANLYLFRQLHHYKVLRLGEELFIRGITRDRIPFIMPTSPPTRIPISLLEEAMSYAQIFFPIPDDWLKQLDTWTIQANFREEDNDYLYTSSKFATYSGRHLDGKRNQIKQLLNRDEVKIEIFSQQVNDALSILDHWQAEHHSNTSQTDYFSCQEALRNFQRLRLHGLIAYVNQQPVGFVIGEWMNKDFYAVHFSKALRSVKGIYPYLFQMLAQLIKGTCSWINLEQDLGIPALRYSKLSYQPDFLARKWRVQIKKEPKD